MLKEGIITGLNDMLKNNTAYLWSSSVDILSTFADYSEVVLFHYPVSKTLSDDLRAKILTVDIIHTASGMLKSDDTSMQRCSTDTLSASAKHGEDFCFQPYSNLMFLINCRGSASRDFEGGHHSKTWRHAPEQQHLCGVELHCRHLVYIFRIW
jgi:hypothetical protein